MSYLSILAFRWTGQLIVSATCSAIPTASASTLDPNEAFSVSSLPVPLTLDPFAYISAPSSADERDPELATLWHELVASYPLMYGVPDKKEWDELTKQSGERWKNGIELVSIQDQAVDQLEE